MPSHPPAMASTSSGAEQATAPALPPDDFYQEPGVAAGSLTQHTVVAPQTAQQPPAPRDDHDLVEGSSNQLPPTDDKHELQRRQLELAASGPPSCLNNAFEEISTESGPSAPLMIDNDVNEYALGADEMWSVATENLPRYHR